MSPKRGSGNHGTGGGTTRGVERSGRYTPPAPRAVRFRLGWHKAVGVVLVAAGTALFFTCQFNGWGIHDYGGHIWYLVGILIAGSSLWWFGAFDPAV